MLAVLMPASSQVAMPTILDQGPVDWSAVLSTLPAADAAGIAELPYEGVSAFLEIGRRRAWNVFQLLCEAGSEFKSRGLRVAVNGDDLRKAALVYRLGDARVDALLPVRKFMRLEIGSSIGGTPEVEIRLSEKHADFLELGDFSIVERYGFKTVSPKMLDGGFGAKVRKGPFNLDLARIEIIESPHKDGNPNFIAIHVAAFPRPKRWHIDPIRLN